MIKLTMFLLAGIGLTMFFADELAKPESTAPMTAKISPEIETQILDHSDLSDKSPIEGLTFASLEVVESPAVVTPAVAAPVTKVAKLVPFTQPVVVETNGNILPAAPTETEVEVAETETIAKPEVAVQFVTATRVNVREGPSTDYSVLGKVVYAEAVQILSDPTEEWVQIRIEGDGIEGFMASRFLQPRDPNS